MLGFTCEALLVKGSWDYGGYGSVDGMIAWATQSLGFNPQHRIKPGVIVCGYHPNTREVEAEVSVQGHLCLRRGYPELHERLSCTCNVHTHTQARTYTRTVTVTSEKE